MPYRVFRRQLTAGYLAPFILTMSGLAAVLLWRIHAQISATAWVEHTDAVIITAKDAQVQLRTMQMELRNYLISPEPVYQSAMLEAQKTFGSDLAKIASMVNDNPQQEQRLLKISELKGTWAKTAENLLKGKGGVPADEDDFEAIRAQSRRLHTSLEAIINAETLLHLQRTARQSEEDQLLLVLIPILSVAVMLVLSFWGWRQIEAASKQFQQALASTEQARAELEKVNKTKDNFLGTLSHELKNPLNSILLWSSTLLREPGLRETARRGISAIERAVRVQSQMVEDLLDVSRIESGRLRLDVQNVNLAEVVRAGVESMRAAAEAKSITLQEVIDPGVDFVVGDPVRLQQVVWNLVSNAVKFTPSGGKVQVRVERINSHLEIIVADNGQGIDSASLNSVFDRFWQAENPGPGRRGIGLGLAIVKEIVTLHGGTVSADSDGPGKGSTFTVRLPLPITTALSIDVRRHPTIAPTATDAKVPRLDGVSILIVDDDPEACEALQNLLGSLGAAVTTANSTREALMKLDSLRVDAVVSDIGMPVEDGHVLARTMRERERDRGGDERIPLVALTAYGRVDDKIEIMTSGFDRHAIKPVDPLELVTMLKTLIAAHNV